MRHPDKRPIKTQFVTHEELEEILAGRREKRLVAVSALVATCVYACAKAWLPDHPQHVSKAMLWMELHAEHVTDPDIAEMLEHTLYVLGELRPTCEPEYEVVAAHH
jgi:hypothetical protein